MQNSVVFGRSMPACRSDGVSCLIELCLEPGETRTITTRQNGVQIVSLDGTLWLTRKDDPVDYFLFPGQRYTVTAPDSLVVQRMRAR